MLVHVARVLLVRYVEKAAKQKVGLSLFVVVFFSEELERSESKAPLKLWVHCDRLDGPEALQVITKSRRITEFDFVNLEPNHKEHVLLIEFCSCTSVKAAQLLISSGRLFCGLSK